MEHILTNLDWLSTGKQFPPKCQMERINKYKNNKELFETEHGEVYKEQLKRVKPFMDEGYIDTHYPVILNYNKLLSIKTADLVCGEPPLITVNEEPVQIDINSLIYKAVIDVSRYGDAVVRVYKGNDGKNKAILVNPTNWFPIIDESTNDIVASVIAWCVEDEDTNKKTLRVQIHQIGFYEMREYQLENNIIGNLISSEIIKTGLSKNAIIHLHNIDTSDTIFGNDDYTPIDSIISELMIRTMQIARILDKHTSPSMQGPDSALSQDIVTGEWKVEAGNYFISDGTNEVKYLTWDSNLESNFKIIDLLLQQLYITSEMGAALLSGQENGTAQSGTAIRLRMMNALMKARRISTLFTPQVKQIISLISEIGYTKVNEEDISIEWNDGLPDDTVELAQLIETLERAKAISIYEKVKMLHPDWDDDAIEDEVELIKEEQGLTVDNPDAPQIINMPDNPDMMDNADMEDNNDGKMQEEAQKVKA